LLQARAHRARREFAQARRLLEEAIQSVPKALGPRILLRETLLHEGQDWPAAEQALRELLRLDPANKPAQHHLARVLRQQGRAAQSEERIPALAP
jgi:tetratricopeptide (TPR) repeat protein